MRFAFVAALTLGTSALLAATAGEARANGRFPETNALFFAPNDPDFVILRTTFGEIISRDHGKTWDWVCERSVGLAGVEDPMHAITPDGTLVSSTFQGLAVSHDRGCNFSFVGGDLKELVFIDLTSRPSTPGTVVAFASSYAGTDDAMAVFFKSTLFETTDQGRSFTALSAPFDPTLLGETVDVTESDPDRIYVSAVRNPGSAVAAVFLTSKDHGKSFEENPIAMVGDERAAFIAGVDPTNANRVYVRTSNASDKPSRLLVTDDAGKSFRTIFTGTGPLAGFALSDDGKRVYVGGMKDGLRAASTTDFAWQLRSPIEIGCLKMNKDGLWACSTEKSGFVAGLSTDDGATFKPQLHFCDIRGPLDCPAGTTTNNECSLGVSANNTAPWPSQRAVLGCSGPTLPEGGSADGGADAATPPGSGDGDDGGCAVRAPSASPFAALLAGLVATIALLRRRR
ncbi:MAG TPA: hypothetical protein VLT33_01615 [Labilithrix sp.]|nr:hypothetical protein [Labilithrix sp.]